LFKTHFNIATPENALKPSNVAPLQKGGEYRWTGTTGADAMVKLCIEHGIKVHGHTLVWYSNHPDWMVKGTREEVIENLEKYITDVVTHFKGRVESWDVVNEALNGGTGYNGDWQNCMRKTGDPWYTAIGPEYVEIAFRAARAADEDAVLYYNDYLSDSCVAVMVSDINERYKAEGNDRNLIEGIGYQGHYYNGSVNYSEAIATINRLKVAGVPIAISEMDISMKPLDWSFSGNKDTVMLTRDAQKQAQFYSTLFSIYKSNKNIISRISMWGMDDKTSWQSIGNPCLFDGNLKPKLSFYAVMDNTLF